MKSGKFFREFHPPCPSAFSKPSRASDAELEIGYPYPSTFRFAATAIP
jgi:hypothetical protein